MEKYYEIKRGCRLYEDYFRYMREDRKTILKAINTLAEKFGIESKEFYPSSKGIAISPTENDLKKFSKELMKSQHGTFKKNTEISKQWCEMVKEVKFFGRPNVIFYFFISGYQTRSRMFNDGDELYCSIETDGQIKQEDFAMEIKASEFYKILEECQNDV